LQKAKQDYFKERSIYYSTFPIREQAEKGEWNKGIAKGEAIGERKNALRMAKALKTKGISVDIIVETSGLSKEEIEKL
jgi:hypothetical protein